MRRYLLFSFLLVGLLVGLFVYLSGEGEKVYEVKRVPYVRSVYATGKVRAYNEVEVKSRVSGYVREVFAEVGERVEEGQLLAVVENEPLRKRLEYVEEKIRALKEKLRPQSSFILSLKGKVEAQEELVKELRRKLKRRKRLLERELISREAYEELKSRYESEKKRLFSLREELKERIRELEREIRILEREREVILKELEQYFMRSPVKGVILKKSVEKGDYVNTFMETKPLFVIGDTSRLKTLLEVDEEYAPLIKEGLKVIVSVEGISGRTYEGKVVRIYGKVDERRKVVTVEAYVNYDEFIPSGLTVDALIVLSESWGYLLPEEAIIDGKYVIVLDQKGKKRVRVEILDASGGRVIVRGLKEGVKVVIP